MTNIIVILVFALVGTLLVTLLEIEERDKRGKEVTKKHIISLALGNTFLLVVVSPLIGIILKHTIL